MPKNVVYILIFFFSLHSFSQRYKDYEIGPMVNYEHTSLYAANDVFNEPDAQGFSNTGYQSNFAAGIYFIYYFRPKMGLGTELYYLKTTSKELENGEYYNSLTFLPYINFDPFRRVENLYFGAGVGISFIQEVPDYGGSVKEEDVRVITLPVKLSTSYRIRNHVTFELGLQAEVIEVVKNKVRRNAIFLGLKIPLNRLNRYYHR